MNRFEQAVYDCMIPTAELLEQTTKPLHRAMLLNSGATCISRAPESTRASLPRT
jgi:hypothetical protein